MNWFWLFAFIFCLILSLCVGMDIKYYFDHFKGDKHGGKDNSGRRK